MCPREDNKNTNNHGSVVWNQSNAPNQAQQQNRNAAMSQLEEFFLGSSSAETTTTTTTTTTSSPISVWELEKDKCSVDEGQGSTTPGVQSTPKPSQAIEKPEQDTAKDHTNQTPSLSHDNFTLLTKQERASSFPTEHLLASSRHSFSSLSRKSSLKKTSSIGRFSQQQQQQPSSSQHFKPSVSFGNLKIREYRVALSDHPSCSYGPPVQLSWEYRQTQVVPLEFYEQSRPPRRPKGDLVLSLARRRFMVLSCGCSKTEINNAMRDAERVKRGRMITDAFLPASPLHETMEHVMDTVKDYFKKQEDV